MRFSSISLITAALAAISGSAIARPGPLRARALEEVNFLERNDVYRRESGVAVLEREVDDLLTRREDQYRDAHIAVIKKLTTAIEAQRAAHFLTGVALHHAPQRRAYFSARRGEHELDIAMLKEMRGEHRVAAFLPGWTPAYNKVELSGKLADEYKNGADHSREVALEAARNAGVRGLHQRP